MAVNMRKLLEGMVKIGASDLHLKVGNKPMIRLHGVLRPIEHPVLAQEDTEEANNLMMPDRCREHFDKIGNADYSYGLSPLERFRVSAYHQRGVISIAIRVINATVPTFESLSLPPVMEKIIEARKGLVLVTGVTGSGKSTTLAAMISLINKTRREHIITIEDPIEYLYEDDKSVIQQVEVGPDILDFKSALRGALRQDPDIILLGELRDRETVETALHCVETGHLVLSTLHTPDAKQTILRILHFFPQEEHALINEQLALNLRGVCCQRLIRALDGKSRLPVCEIMINTPIVTKLIREMRYEDLEKVLLNEEDGMQAFDMHLVQWVKAERISIEEALALVNDEAAFRRALAGRSAGGDRRALIR